ncbi:glycosyl transferase [Paramagnetospirillum kuznetsovii]|uniref:Glycosyl transferase n=1 Tax=Paramagnetospirillum kuznetsovii TaxID=2053833 RepID=A0A364P321_9PROT|nr:glycosyltransferase family 4 protein [Paramagnetospirillum kuznetsovii]RAU23749.1 glycosyl transferase [Paramagnetospirillum kuznetsovii]
MEIALAFALATLIASVAATRGVLAWLRHKQILDHPNERSSHALPTPRGGGLAVTPVMAAGLVLVAFVAPGYVTVLAAGALILMAVSWLDDRRGLPPLPRFLLQAAVIAATLLGLDTHILAFSGLLPLWADRLLVGLGWLWFVNLYNFMDGIDGISGVETGGIGIGIALVAPNLAPQALIVAAAGLGFLAWNWHPARIFLGDSGSIPLGYVLGGLLVMLAGQGELAAALILPAYYVADSTITLLWRLKDGEKIWQAHRRHFYQRAVQGGKSHSQVSLAIAGGNILLMGCALVAGSGWIWAGAVLAVIVVAGMLVLLTHWARP